MLLWAILLIGFFAFQAHRKLLASTRLNFTVFLDGSPIDADVRLNGELIHYGDRVKLGRRDVLVSHPKAVAVRTNLFIWYGENSLGRIDLKRAKGRLELSVKPMTGTLLISGADFTTSVSNATNFSAEVPTGEYLISAAFKHSSVERRIVVAENRRTLVELDAHLGALRLRSNKEGVQFKIAHTDGKSLVSGMLPSEIQELPANTYVATAIHRRKSLQKEVTVREGATNEVSLDFEYGSIELSTMPAGARVFSANRGELGVTPLSLSELDPGRVEFELVLQGHDGVRIAVPVEANRTNRSTITLTNTMYRLSMEDGEGRFSQGDFAGAAAAFSRALESKPQDATATQRGRVAIGYQHLAAAERFSQNFRTYESALDEANNALRLMPQNERAKILSESMKQQLAFLKTETDKIKRERPRKLFKQIVERAPGAAAFESHTITSELRLAEAATSLIAEFKKESTFKLIENTVPESGTFHIVGEHEYMTALKTVAGKTQCIIVGGELPEGGTEIHFVVVELKSEPVNKFSIGAAIGASVAVNFVPLQNPDEKEKARRVKDLPARIVAAVKAKSS